MMQPVVRTITYSLLVAILLLSALWIFPAPVQAATVTQLDITSESVSLNFGTLGILSGTFNQTGQLIMGQSQPIPNIFPPVTLGGHLTFSVLSNAGQPVFNLPTPSGTTSSSTMTVDLSSLFAGLSSTQWGSWMTPATFGALNIGGTGDRVVQSGHECVRYLLDPCVHGDSVPPIRDVQSARHRASGGGAAAGGYSTLW